MTEETFVFLLRTLIIAAAISLTHYCINHAEEHTVTKTPIALEDKPRPLLIDTSSH